MNKIIIAIDGPAASGKSTVAKRVASLLNYKYIDTGAMYRALSLYALDNNLNIQQILSKMYQVDISFDENNHVYLNGEDVSNKIRTSEVTNKVPEIAANALVRAYLVSLQQKMGKDKGIVMDGRDIGSVVFPQAELKIYQIASPLARAKRRHDELLANGFDSDLEILTKEIENRDYLDMNREASPLVKVDDAIELDTSNMSIEESVKAVINLVEKWRELHGK